MNVQAIRKKAEKAHIRNLMRKYMKRFFYVTVTKVRNALSVKCTKFEKIALKKLLKKANANKASF